ncbi:uncharacterized protein PHACADRAFT_194408 [Phanerochaete carnosa HHB-10118-sp]|uniref:Uncharacterized protein n=1 Tax=Phanerochaete carnosa (strain HHB-10118-sp) TaxID=650164 RepID=K5V2R7_PHACS|nr:uncharacterized protein PHACADRAFT_194408 [Phanerochaete carnosa HHB-10118-sp]EKM56826.1 hypothetical protein PHACADRAFT_194408 [Phanerochaete carnosa HHB-10118-sp]
MVKRHVEELSGILPVYHNMCINSCIGFIGLFKDLELCSMCSRSCYNKAELKRSGKKIPVKQFLTNCMGPAIQTMWCSLAGAKGMTYRQHCITKIIEEMQPQDGKESVEFSVSALEDYIHGTDYLKAVLQRDIGPDNTVLMLSLDRAQLYQNKTSDIWIYIWVMMDCSSDTRYKKHNVYVSGVISGLNKPKNINSFLFPGFWHLAALMKEHLQILNGSMQKLFTSDPYILTFGANQIGITQLTGLVRHHGHFGCWLYCLFSGCCKNRSGHYFQAAQLPRDHHVNNSDHSDVEIDNIFHETHTEKIHRYNKNLQRFLSDSRSQAAYERICLETGISKPSIVSGFSTGCMLGVPGCFQTDLFHLASLNIPDLYLSLL